MQGHIRARSPGSWELKFDAGRDASGKRQIKYRTVRGTKRDAQRELRRLLGQVDAGTHADPGKLTLGQYIDQWLAGHRTAVSALTAQRYSQLIDWHIKPVIGTMPLAKVTPLALNQLYADRLEHGRRDGKGGLSPQTVRHIDRLLHNALEDAVVSRLIALNPADHAKRPKVEKPRPRPLSDEEYMALLDEAEGTRLKAPIVVILGTGLRRGELLALRWRDVNFDTAALSVTAAVEDTAAHGLRIKEPKTTAGRRRVDLPPFVVETLLDHRRQQQEEHLQLGLSWTPDALVFGDPFGQLQRPNRFTQQVMRLARRAGVTFTAHKGRHEHFSRLLAAGCHPKVAQLRAGHGSIAVTMDLYSHASEALQKQAADYIENAHDTIQKRLGGNRVANVPQSKSGKVVKL